MCVPLFLGERLLPHGQMLLVFHQTEKRGACLDPQPIVVVFRITPDRNEEGGNRSEKRQCGNSSKATFTVYKENLHLELQKNAITIYTELFN